MQHTEVLELNACITYLRTGKELPRKNTEAMYDMRWTFTAPRDPTITELYVGSPGDDAWMPTTADMRAEQQRRIKEREDEARRTATPQPQKSSSSASAITPVPLSGLRPPLEFKRKQVASRAQPLKSALTMELTTMKRQGPVVGGGNSAAPTGPSVKLTIYLPDRTPVEIRVAKTATVDQAIVAVLERCRDKLGKRKADRYEIRLHDSDGLPDDDFPAVDGSSIISETGNSEFCLCDTKDGDDGDTDGEQEVVPVVPVKSTPPPMVQPVMSGVQGGVSAITRSKSMGGQHIIRVTPSADLEAGTEYKIWAFEPREATALNVLKKFINQLNLPLVADEYILVMKDEDRERLGMPLPHLKPSDNLAELGLENVIIQKRKYADSPLDADRVDQLRTLANPEAARRPVDNKRTGAAAGAAGGPGGARGANPGGKAQEQAAGVMGGGAGAGGGAVGGNGGDANAKAAPHVTINEPARSDVMNTPVHIKSKESNLNPKSGQGGKSTGKKDTSAVKAGRVANGAIDPDSILLNEISASRYEEWDVVKTNNWGKHQNRTLGIDGYKIYNKARSEGGFGGSVKNAERLISDVESIEIHPTHPNDFTIRVREPLGNTATLNYRADSAEIAAKIVAKIKYNKSGQMSRN